MRETNELTSSDYWESVHAGQPRLRLPSRLVISTRNLQRILKSYIRPEMHVLEVGFAPGKQLAYVSKVLGAVVTGVDYSEHGVDYARRLFQALGIQADLRREDIFQSTLSRASFDFVYSVGLVEHFDDPSQIVRCHAELLRPGGKALILIPNYSGMYGRLQRYFDPENLLIHNIDIMTCEALSGLAPKDIIAGTRTFRTGRINPSLVSFHKKWPIPLAKSFSLMFTAVGHLQPIDIDILCPWLAL